MTTTNIQRLLDAIDAGTWDDLHGLAEKARAEVAPAEIHEVIVMWIGDLDDPSAEVEIDDEETFFRTGDLVLVCPSCEAENDLIQRDRATCEHVIDVEEGWISVADTRHSDFHDLDFLCGGCRRTVSLPEAAETRVVWG